MSNRRHVSIHLTPYAPGVGEAAIGDRARWIAQWSVTPELAMAHLCHRLKVEPMGVTALEHGLDIEIRARVAGEAQPVVVAIIAYGLDLAEILAALAQISTARAAA